MTQEPLDPDSIPHRKLNCDAIASEANLLRSTGISVADAGHAAWTNWQGLSAHYVAPEGQVLLNVLAPVSPRTLMVGGDMNAAADALAAFAEAATPLVAKLKQLEINARDFKIKIWGGITVARNDPDHPDYTTTGIASNMTVGEEDHLEWYEYEPWVTENNDRIDAVTATVQLLEDESAICIGVLQSMTADYAGVCAAPYESIPWKSAAEAGVSLPWGTKATLATSHESFVSNHLDPYAIGLAGPEDVKYLLQLLVGYNPKTDEWWDPKIYEAAGVAMATTVGALIVQPLDKALDKVQGAGDSSFDDPLDVASADYDATVGNAWQHVKDGLFGSAEDWALDPDKTAGEVSANAAGVAGAFVATPPGLLKLGATLTKLGIKIGKGDPVKDAAFSQAVQDALAATLTKTGGAATSLGKLAELPAKAMVDLLHEVAEALNKLDGRMPETSPGNRSPDEPDGPHDGNGGSEQKNSSEETPAAAEQGISSPGDGRTPSVATTSDEPSTPKAADTRQPPNEPGDRGPAEGIAEGRAPKMGVPAHDGGIENPVEVNPAKAVIGENPTITKHSAAFDESVEVRTGAEATRVVAAASQTAKLSELAADGVTFEKGELLTNTYKSTIDSHVKATFSNPDLDAETKQRILQNLEDLIEITLDERIALKEQVKASHTMGEIAAQDAIASQNAEVIVNGLETGKDSFDQIGLSKDGSTLIVAEGKGGTGTLSKTGRTLPDGTRVEQGSTLYFNDVFANDKALQDYFATHPDLVTGLANGSVKVSYQLVTATPSGKIKVKELVLNPEALDLTFR